MRTLKSAKPVLLQLKSLFIIYGTRKYVTTQALFDSDDHKLQWNHCAHFVVNLSTIHHLRPKPLKTKAFRSFHSTQDKTKEKKQPTRQTCMFLYSASFSTPIYKFWMTHSFASRRSRQKILIFFKFTLPPNHWLGGKVLWSPKGLTLYIHLSESSITCIGLCSRRSQNIRQRTWPIFRSP